MVRKMFLSKKELYELYINQRMSSYDIAEEIGLDRSTVCNWLHRYQIPIRIISEAVKGRKSWNKGLTKNDLRVRKYCFNRGNFKKGEHSWNKGLTKEIDDRVRAYGKKQKGKTVSEETRRRMSEADNGRIPWNKGINMWKSRPEGLMRALRCQSPNNSEKKLIRLFEEKALPFKYVGDGKIIIEGRIPDFINYNGRKQVIEVFGNYWHSPLYRPKMNRGRTYENTIKHYNKYGFDCLIVWESELSNEKRLVEKIQQFVE